MEERDFMALEYYKHCNFEVVKENFRMTFPGRPVPCDKTIRKYMRKIRYFGSAEDEKYVREAPVLNNLENNTKMLESITANSTVSVRKLASETGIKQTSCLNILNKNNFSAYKF